MNQEGTMTDEATGAQDAATMLLDCPFCGCEPQIDPPWFIFRWWGIMCPNMNCPVHDVSGKTYQAVARKWNKRKGVKP